MHQELADLELPEPDAVRLPGLAGVGDKKAAELVGRYGGLDGLLESGRLGAAERDYVERARRVVPPVTDLPIELPAGRRERYPADPERVEALARRLRAGGLATPELEALLQTALAGLRPASPAP